MSKPSDREPSSERERLDHLFGGAYEVYARQVPALIPCILYREFAVVPRQA